VYVRDRLPRTRLEWEYEMCTQTWAVWVRSLAYRRDPDSGESPTGVARGVPLARGGLVVCVAIGMGAHHAIGAWVAHILMVMMR
jgi:hypothetical protein